MLPSRVGLLLAPWFDGRPCLTIIQHGFSTQHHRKTASTIDIKNIFSCDGDIFQQGGDTEGSECKKARTIGFLIAG
jgi:hypothetical protein